MKQWIIPILMIVIATISVSIWCWPKPAKLVVASIKPISCEFSEAKLLELFNSSRNNKLMIDNYLDNVTNNRAKDIPYWLDDHKGFNTISHNGTLSRYQYVGEILATTNCSETEKVFNQFKNSSTHWSVITNERYDVVGIGFNGVSTVAIFGDLK